MRAVCAELSFQNQVKALRKILTQLDLIIVQCLVVTFKLICTKLFIVHVIY